MGSHGAGTPEGQASVLAHYGIDERTPALAREAATRALDMQKREVTTNQRLRAGEKLPDITGATAIVEAKLVKR